MNNSNIPRVTSLRREMSMLGCSRPTQDPRRLPRLPKVAVLATPDPRPSATGRNAASVLSKAHEHLNPSTKLRANRHTVGVLLSASEISANLRDMVQSSLRSMSTSCWYMADSSNSVASDAGSVLSVILRRLARASVQRLSRMRRAPYLTLFGASGRLPDAIEDKKQVQDAIRLAPARQSQLP